MSGLAITGTILLRLWPVWIALIATFVLSARYKSRLGLYGKLMGSSVGRVGLGLVLFWVFVAIFGDIIATHNPLTAVSGMKNKLPGTAFPDGSSVYLLGGDNLARDVFSRAVLGARQVLAIAPLATLFAFMVGITLGLPAGYQGGKLDTLLSFLANLVLAFPVILLFYLLVTPEIVDTGIPRYMAGVLFLFPLLFYAILINSRFHTDPAKRNRLLAYGLIPGLWLYAALAFNFDVLIWLRDITGLGSLLGWVGDTLTSTIAGWLGAPFTYLAEAGGVSMPANILIVFVSVVFVNAPTVFRIVRGLTLDIKTRDYVAAAQTRGEKPWYIMLWEILPNARGPLIVDFCLRIGYVTILLGTLGFFGLGVSPESPDWGTTINDGRKLLSQFPWPALVPALSLMSLVLGLNLLADGLREESLRD
jgi:peptide/nickel transport system permease protein